jgi:hypothetical protein
VPRSEITCREFVELIPVYRDDELSMADRQSFAQHIWKCRRCWDYLKGYDLTVGATKRIGEDPLDPGDTNLPKSLVNRILDSRLKNGSRS